MRSDVSEAVSIIEQDLTIARDLAIRVFGQAATPDHVFSILSLLYTEMSIVVAAKKLEESLKATVNTTWSPKA